MGIGILEYHASAVLETLASNLRDNTGANEFYSLLGALYRLAGTYEQEALMKAFPGTFEEMKQRYNAPAGLIKPGERVTIGNLLCIMDNDGKVKYTEVEK